MFKKNRSKNCQLITQSYFSLDCAVPQGSVLIHILIDPDNRLYFIYNRNILNMNMKIIKQTYPKLPILRRPHKDVPKYVTH